MNTNPLKDWAGPSQAVNDWWSDWYKKSVQSNENINAMPFVFNSSGGQNNPMGIGPMMELLKGMYSQPKQAAADPSADPRAGGLSGLVQGGLVDQLAAGNGGGLFGPAASQGQAPQMPINDPSLLAALGMMGGLK